MITRNDLIREARTRGGSWPALLVIYGVLIGTMALTAAAMI